MRPMRGLKRVPLDECRCSDLASAAVSGWGKSTSRFRYTLVMTSLKLTAIGNSTGLILPKEMLERLRVGRGDSLNVVETPTGILLSPFDPDFNRRMDLAERIMREDRDVLQRLAQ